MTPTMIVATALTAFVGQVAGLQESSVFSRVFCGFYCDDLSCRNGVFELAESGKFQIHVVSSFMFHYF